MPVELDTLPNTDPGSLYWRRKLDALSPSLTKPGNGRLVTTNVASALQSEVEKSINASIFSTHPFARQAITEAVSGILSKWFSSTGDQVENCIEPYGYKIDVDDPEWAKGRHNLELPEGSLALGCAEEERNVEAGIGETGESEDARREGRQEGRREKGERE